MLGADSSATPKVGGWLLVLAGALLIWHPLNVAVTASRALASLDRRGVPLALVMTARVCIAALGISSGLAILGRRTSAVGLTAAALISSAAADVFVLSTSYVPTNLPPGDAPIYLTVSLIYHAAWLAYLFRSRRVRSTLIS